MTAVAIHWPLVPLVIIRQRETSRVSRQHLRLIDFSWQVLPFPYHRPLSSILSSALYSACAARLLISSDSPVNAPHMPHMTPTHVTYTHQKIISAEIQKLSSTLSTIFSLLPYRPSHLLLKKTLLLKYIHPTPAGLVDGIWWYYYPSRLPCVCDVPAV